MASEDLPSLKDRYIAAMVLSGSGDALGYKNGSWEFCHSGQAIHDELHQLGGVDNIKVELPGWMVSDDTVMHVATAEALVSKTDGLCDDEALYMCLASNYKACMNEMDGRAPGMTCTSSCHMLKPTIKKGYCIPFLHEPRGCGCGAAMRSMCIGLRYPSPAQIDDLVRVSIESGRMTHHNPIGYLGALATALFTAYAIQSKPIREWGHGLMEILKKAKEYIVQSGVFVKENIDKWGYFEDKWREYLDERNVTSGSTTPVFPEIYGVKERDAFYNSVSLTGWGGASGHDAPMIAYDALLGYGGDWRELCRRAMFHGGDSDSTGVIAACCYGAMHGFNGVMECNHKHLEKEYRERLQHAAIRLYHMSHPDDMSSD